MSIEAKKHNIYLDNAAATPVDGRVMAEMNSVGSVYGNPSSFNNVGREAKKKLEESRLKVARFLGARPEEIIFTSSGSEANNMAVMCPAFAAPKEKNELITTPIEHLSVLEPLKFLKYEGKESLFVRVDNKGLINVEDIRSKLSTRTMLVSIMYANNEIGTIEPIKKIGKLIKDFKKDSIYPLLHVDACQAAGYLDMNVNNLGVDLLTFNGGKIYGPHGIGVLYIKRNTPFVPYIMGGGQERGYRAGTENLSAIAGLAKALEIINTEDSSRTSKLRDYFLNRLEKELPEIKINGATGSERLPNNINISIPGMDSENLLLELDKYGISAGSGSACTSHSVEPSHVLKAIGVPEKYLNGALRLSLGRQTRKKDLDYVLEVLPKVISDIRKRYKK